MPNTHLTFNEFVFNPYPVNGSEEIYLKGSELATALGYSREDSLNKIVERNRDEFEKGMFENVKLTLSGNIQKTIRVFSLRGANLVAMKAKTPIANEFRKWVLDVLEAHPVEQRLPQQNQAGPYQDLKLEGGVIRIVNGLYRLTDLSNLKKHRDNLPDNHPYIPAKWKRSAKVIKFIQSIANEYGDSGTERVFKVVRSYDTEASGTYVVEEILLEYARWIDRGLYLEVKNAISQVKNPTYAPVTAELPKPTYQPAAVKREPIYPNLGSPTKDCGSYLQQFEELAVKELSQLRAICMLVKHHADLGEKLDPDVLEPTMWTILDKLDALDEAVGNLTDKHHGKLLR